MDSLCYRFPDETEIRRKSGVFRLQPDASEPTGFVVSDFLHQRVFVFEESDHTGTEQSFHLSTEKPVVISPRDYQIEAQAMLNAFPLFGVEKAVYSRVKQVTFPVSKARELFDAVCEKYPSAFCYLISSAHFGTWIGASPELLLARKGLQVRTVALASTQKVNEERDWTAKEDDEHTFVSEAIEETLKRHACFDIERDGPKIHLAGPVKHLKTAFSAILTQPNTWSIAMDLHPTPAVCGTPRLASLDLLTSREIHQRELYTGMIGWHDTEETRLFVNLRCAQLFENAAYLYVGGGYTVDSIPDLEWEETENKAATLLQVMRTIY